MPEIKCPNCGEVFSVDENDYAQIVSQIKDKAFKEELDEAKHALKELNCKVTNIYEYDLPLGMGHHAIIEIEKLEKTKNKYPRVYAKIKKQPL